MKVFLTGATGFVGSALLQRLLANSVGVIALVRGKPNLPQDSLTTIVGDLSTLDEDTSSSVAFALKDVDVVVHAAARAHIMKEIGRAHV